MPKALTNYEESIKSPETRRTYDKFLKHFLAYSQVTPDQLVKMKTSQLEELVISYIVKLKKRVEAKDLSPNSFNVAIAPIQLILEQNDVILNWKKIKRMFPRRVKPQGELPYTTKDIQDMLKSNSSPRSRAFIHVLASTGCRIGAIKELRVEHLQEIEDCCAITFQENDLEEYIGFLTPEAYQSLKEYFDHRREHGEVIRPESPLFSGTGHHAGKVISPKALEQITHSVLKKSRIRPNNTQKNRYAKAQNHGFRKRFNTILKMNNTINSNIVEKLMGHKNGLDGVYLKPTLEECFNEFKKAIPELTVSNEHRERAQKVKLEEMNKKLTIDREEFENIKADLEEQKSMAEGWKKIRNLDRILRLLDKEDGLHRLEKRYDLLQENQK